MEKHRMPSRPWLATALFTILIAASPHSYAEEEMSWTANRFESETPDGTPMAVLHYGIPETDAVAFEATCGGPDGPEPRAVFWYDITDFDEGDDVSLEILAGDFEDELPAKVYGKELEVGVSGIQVTPPTDAPLWQAMATRPDLSYGVEGGEPVKLSLNGASAAVGEFVAACEALSSAAPMTPEGRASMATPPSAGMDRTDGSDLSSAGAEGSGSGSGVTDEAAQAAMATADGMDAPEMPAGGPLNPAAEVVSCEEFGTIKSKESDTQLTVTFVNLSDGYCGLV
jgi:hypothetical protein